MVLVGTLAVSTDTAQTGGARIETSGEVAVDLQISTDDAGPAAYGDPAYHDDCDTGPPGGGFAEDQDAATPIVVVSNAQPQTMASGARVSYVCLRNAASNGVTLTGTAVTDLTDTETACAPGEAAVDASCGSGAGELSSEVRLELYVGPGDGTCRTPASGENVESHAHDGVSGSPTSAWSVAMGPGSTRCAVIAAGYLDTLTTPTEQTANGFDSTSFRLRFEATGP